MIKQLTAVTLHRFLNSGRNEPALFACLDEQGQPAGDYVVKLAGNTTQQQLAHELIGSLLADHFHLLHPAPAIVQIHPELISWLQRSLPHKSAVLATSKALNFGCEYLTDTPTWPIGNPLSDTLLATAADIFAFDALISNDDRRRTNPNILLRGDQLFIIDHELAFSFLYLLLNRDQPWDLTNRNNLQEHVFFYALRKKSLNFDRFIQHLTDLGESALESIISAIPNSWRSDQLPKISTHLKQVRDNARKFEIQLAGRLAA